MRIPSYLIKRSENSKKKTPLHRTLAGKQAWETREFNSEFVILNHLTSRGQRQYYRLKANITRTCGDTARRVFVKDLEEHFVYYSWERKGDKSVYVHQPAVDLDKVEYLT